ncbi:hypothetical protein [Winogradskyella sp. 3972H.M.0a.05]|uniref:hypothetical protein n=1 Tax=Winogradskyella sp. 3972H.M.0a.05 TaxID=2950277 RepID=UPI00339765C0
MIPIRIFTLLLLAFVCTSCGVSFSKKEFRKDYVKLTESNINQLNGEYLFYPSKRYGKPSKNKRASDIRYANLYQEIVNESYNNKKQFDSARSDRNVYKVKLDLINKQLIKLQVYENDSIIRDTMLVGKLKKGMFYLDNKYFKCHGVPYIFGGCQSSKRRIGLSKNKTLIVNEAASNEGALLIVLAAGYSYNASYEYSRAVDVSSFYN